MLELPAKKDPIKSPLKQVINQTNQVNNEIKAINKQLFPEKQKENRNSHVFEQTPDLVSSKELNKRLNQVESSILGIYKTLNLLEKMTEQNSTQLKHIIDLCNKRDLE